MRNFQKLSVWEKAHSLCLSVYRETTSFPPHEKYGIVSQIRRASVSIPTNIAEGSGRRTEADYARFLDISIGSCSEVEYLVMLSADLGHLEKKSAAGLTEQIVEVRRMLLGLAEKIRSGS